MTSRTGASARQQTGGKSVDVLCVDRAVAIHVCAVAVAPGVLLCIAGWIEQGLYECRDIQTIGDRIAVCVSWHRNDAQPRAEWRFVCVRKRPVEWAGAGARPDARDCRANRRRRVLAGAQRGSVEALAIGSLHRPRECRWEGDIRDADAVAE